MKTDRLYKVIGYVSCQTALVVNNGLLPVNER